MAKTKTQIKKWILENCINDDGIIDLTNIDFENKVIDLSEIRAIKIFNQHQKAKFICNSDQEAKDEIYNGSQKGYRILNTHQKSNNLIDNSCQKAFKKIINYYQTSKEIDNSYQIKKEEGE